MREVIYYFGYTIEELEEMFFCEPVSWPRPDVVVVEGGDGVIEVYSCDGDGIDEVEEYIQSFR